MHTFFLFYTFITIKLFINWVFCSIFAVNFVFLTTTIFFLARNFVCFVIPLAFYGYIIYNKAYAAFRVSVPNTAGCFFTQHYLKESEKRL